MQPTRPVNSGMGTAKSGNSRVNTSVSGLAGYSKKSTQQASVPNQNLSNTIDDESVLDLKQIEEMMRAS